MSDQPQNWLHVPSLEWMLGATWAVGTLIMLSVWRLALKVSLLEQLVVDRDASIERRHSENLHAWRELREHIARLTERIDRLMDRH